MSLSDTRIEKIPTVAVADDRALARIVAVVWLSLTSGTAILKLTQADYAGHQLSSLVARHGSPGAVNGAVFNAIGA